MLKHGASKLGDKLGQATVSGYRKWLWAAGGVSAGATVIVLAHAGLEPHQTGDPEPSDLKVCCGEPAAACARAVACQNPLHEA